MKERPMLFSAPMVKALLAGTKTQTRRIMKPQPRQGSTHDAILAVNGFIVSAGFIDDVGLQDVKFPYGSNGCRIWVKETFRPQDGMTMEYRDRSEVEYRADGDRPKEPTDCHWKPSIFMPRWASRITLEIEQVRVERLNDISEEDAKAEGCEKEDESDESGYITESDIISGYTTPQNYSIAYERLWERINGPGSWAKNPWVWAITFRRLLTESEINESMESAPAGPDRA